MATNLRGESRSRYIRVIERDPDVPRDSEGSPTVSGREWVINPAFVTAVKVDPDRGGSTDVWLHVAGVPEPIRCCESDAWISEMLGAPTSWKDECQMCGRPRHGHSSRWHGLICRACDGAITACEDDDDDDD